jgi:YcaO-like protein with predicted kinase domain
VADITGLDVIGLPVVTVCRPNSRNVTVSLGKGFDLAAARASGVMESIEAFMAERINGPLILGSVNDLRTDYPLVDVDLLPKINGSAYRPDLPVLWIEGQDQFTGTPRWIPYEMVHTSYTLPAPAGTGCFVASSSGLASGNHLLEATSHGICETVERDAATLHSVRPQAEAALRLVDPRTVDDPGCAAALDRLDRAGMSVAIWDITSDVGIAAFQCLIAETGGGPVLPGQRATGLGCHPDPKVALLRALTEAAQSRLAFISGACDEPADWDRAGRADPAAPPPAQAAEQAGEAARDFAAVPAFDSDSLDADVAWELAALRAAGIREVVAVDLTREEFGIPVVRIIIPGLEGPVTTVPSCRLGRRAMDLIGADGRDLRLPRPHAHAGRGER